ncbi:hypothetical protein NEOLEDRAFT_448150 [Neolentinus lepideus HHB14362 ss-1]|uniref:RRM domain-containing protein n=1 Tax=Neolentinus lepideus HHB14362 ss-1 TaxID=1314782 RepID=A0A165RSU7_9AGAM|nr:hypothetical protein NEOLEDRAFT_448150 [Neolentinus lepideus HHB14362 ss-1]
MDKFPAHIPAGQDKILQPTTQRALHTKQSLPNLWLPPRYGPIPAHLNRPQPAPPQPQPPSPNPPRMSHKLDPGTRTPLLTPPLTPASSRRTASSVEDVVAGVDAISVEDGSRFLLISSLPTRLSADALQAMFAPYSGEVKGMYVRLHESHGLVVLAFWDEGAAGKVRRQVDGAAVLDENGEVRLSKEEGGEKVGARFVSADELREVGCISIET